MKILLSYSKRHFDPALPREQHQFWGSSASILARTLHGLLAELGDVTYVDSTELARVRGQSFDLFVGLINNFGEFLATCRIRRSVCLVVNQHSRERNRLILAGAKSYRVPRAARASWELRPWRQVQREERALARATAILCVGNELTLNSYVRHGIARAKIKRLHYGLPGVVPTRAEIAARPERRVVYVASEVGLRKGFDQVEELTRSALDAGYDFRLDVVGQVSTPYYQKRLAKLVRAYPRCVTSHGWIDSTDPRYGELLAQADYVLLPSLEEGQVGTLLDALARGAIPLISDRCGIDFAPLGYLEPTKGSAANHALFRRALELDASSRERLREAALQYYAGWHEGFEASLRTVLTRFAREGELYPKLSVVLPVFNKEPHLHGLLTYLDAALGRYPRAELRLILDGCRDASEAIARRFFDEPRRYSVTFEVTPDIFEVRSNNLGLRQSRGDICAIVQDDNYLYDRDLFFEAADVFELNPSVAVLGGLAGVNFYPRGFRPRGKGQISTTPQEVYWRQDENTAPELKHRVFEVDACMRGPLFLRKQFLEREGYLDEAYAPLYMDDMDLCFRARERGYRVMAALMEVENRSLTMAHYSAERNQKFEAIYKRNTDLFYARFQPSIDKSDQQWVHRHHVPDLDRKLAVGRRIERELKQGLQRLKLRARPLKKWAVGWLERHGP